MDRPLFVRGNSLKDHIPRTENHIHTTFSDGRNTPEEYVLEGIRQGLESIIFTDHVNRTSSWFGAYAEEINRLKSKYNRDIKIYTGIEAKALDYHGTVDATDEMIKTCDIVIGVVHRCPNPEGGMLEFVDMDSALALELEYKAAKGLLEKGRIHILGHMGAMYELFFGPFPDNLHFNLIDVAQKNNRVIELSSKYHPRMETLVDYCCKVNPWVSLGSDAHDINQLGNMYRRLRGE